MKVAALVYFEEGTTVKQAETIIRETQLQLGEVVFPLDSCTGARIDRAVVREYHPDHGEPVWYIP